MAESTKPLVWLHGQVKSPPFSRLGRRQAGFLLRMVQEGEPLAMPHSRPMPSISRRCHELRIQDEDQTWRVVYRIDPDVVVIVHVFSKKTPTTPKRVVEVCRDRLRVYDRLTS